MKTEYEINVVFTKNNTTIDCEFFSVKAKDKILAIMNVLKQLKDMEYYAFDLCEDINFFVTEKDAETD